MTKVVWDEDLCQAHGVCTLIDPDRFQFNDDDSINVLKPEVSEADLPLVNQAISGCPVGALKLVED
jgi:ferredoxin